MCGRYYVDEDTAKEINRLIDEAEIKTRVDHIRTGTIFPTEQATVLLMKDNKLTMENQNWGISLYTDQFSDKERSQKGCIINAKSETVRQKALFSAAVERNRVVIPAKAFYEWNREKEKYAFYKPDQSTFYMAGFWKQRDEKREFVIMTREANDFMKKVHDRMPVLLSQEDMKKWLEDGRKWVEMLNYPAPELISKTDYEQLSLFSNEL